MYIVCIFHMLALSFLYSLLHFGGHQSVPYDKPSMSEDIIVILYIYEYDTVWGSVVRYSRSYTRIYGTDSSSNNDWNAWIAFCLYT